MVPPDFRSREGGAGDFDAMELLYRVFPMNSTYRYLPIYVNLLHRDFPMKSLYSVFLRKCVSTDEYLIR